MLKGRVAVFLSCSDHFKVIVARSICDLLEEHDIHGIIVSDEPFLPGASGDPESKVETYLDACDAFVALATPDDQLSDGTTQTRQNIIDEYGRARSRPRLRNRIQVFKHQDVRLPSNVNPTYERLQVEDVSAVSALILRQLDTWGLLEAQPRPTSTPTPAPSAVVANLIDGLELGEYEEARRRAYEILLSANRDSTAATIEELRQFLRSTGEDDNTATLLAGAVLESIGRLDASLVPVDVIEELAASNDFSVRSVAAYLMWDRAEIAPAEVPLGLLGRLALPSTEDWYVQAPAMAAVKLLLLHRRDARVIFDRLAASEDPEDRYAVAAALLDVAKVDPWAAPRDLAEQLAADEDSDVAAKGNELLAAIPVRGEDERDPLRPFGL